MKRLFGLLFIIIILSCTHLKQAHQFYDNGDYDAAISACETAIQRDSTDAGAFFLLGQSYHAKGSLQQAESAISTALELEPESRIYRDGLAEVHVAKGESKSEKKEYGQTIVEYEKALQLQPDNADIIVRIGDTYFDAGKHDLAQTEFLKSLKIGADSTIVQGMLNEINDCRRRSDELFKKGQSELKKKHYNKAIDLFSEALTVKPDFSDAKYSLHIATGLRLHKKGSKAALWDAIVEFGYAATLRPDLAEPHYLSARSYEKKDRNEFYNAIREYQLAAEIEPNSELSKKSLIKAKELKARQKRLKEFWGK